MFARRFSLFLGLLLLFSCAEPPGKSPSEIFIFGDSLSDTGNLYLLSERTIPGEDYYLGRYSNNQIYVDMLAEQYQLDIRPALPPILGNNFAVAGMRINDPDAIPAIDGLPSDIAEQVSYYLTNKTQSIEKEFLYIVWGGGNDVRDVISGAQTSESVTTAITALKASIQSLHDAGATQILVPNIPDLGIVPEITEQEATAPGITALASGYSTDFNNALDSMLDELIAAGVGIIKYDIAGLLNNVVADPAAYNLSNATDRCYVDTNTICASPETYLFWDGLHPTNAGHRIISDEFISVIP